MTAAVEAKLYYTLFNKRMTLLNFAITRGYGHSKLLSFVIPELNRVKDIYKYVWKKKTLTICLNKIHII